MVAEFVLAVPVLDVGVQENGRVVRCRRCTGPPRYDQSALDLRALEYNVVIPLRVRLLLLRSGLSRIVHAILVAACRCFALYHVVVDDVHCRGQAVRGVAAATMAAVVQLL